MVLHSEEALIQWKKAIIIPIPKNSFKSMSNFSVISLMSIARKVFNRAILNRKYDEVSSELCSFYAGLRTGKSCIEQIHIIGHILEQNHQKSIPIIIT